MANFFRNKIRLLLTLANVVLVVVSLLSAVMFYDLLTDIGEEAVRVFKPVTDMVDTSRKAHVAFQREVQAWKNVLLRGRDPELYRRHYDELATHHEAVRSALRQLAVDMAQRGLDNAQVLQVLRQHTEIKRRYDEALIAYPPGKTPDNLYKADAEVRGIDRELSSALDQLTEHTEAQVVAQMSSLGGVVRSQHTGEDYYFLMVLLILLPMSGIAAFQLAARLSRQLNEEKERAEVTLSSIGDAVIVTDAVGKIEYMNPTAEALTQWGLQEARGKLRLEIFHVVDARSRQVVADPVERTIREGRGGALGSDLVLIGREGKEYAIEGTAAPMHDADGKIRGVVLAFYDMTEKRQALNELERQEKLFRSTFEQAVVGIAHVGLDGTWMRLNQRLCDIVGYRHRELLQHTFSDIIHPEDREDRQHIFNQLIAGELRTYNSEKRCLHKDGHSVWVNLTVGLVRTAEGEPDFFVAVLEDISERKRMESETHALQAQYRVLFEQLPDAVVLLNRDGRVVGHNERAAIQLGYSHQEMTALNIADLEAEQSPEQITAHMWHMLQTGQLDYETRHRKASGELLDVHVSMRTVEMLDGSKLYQCVLRDISERRDAQRKIEYLAYHDALTGLPNRRLLQDRIEKAVGNAQRRDARLGLLFIDMDRFKVINDTLGHEVGDALLKLVAARLRECVREQDTIARIGGDEFVVLLLDIRESSDAAVVAEKLVSRLSMPYDVQGHTLYSTPSIGISIFPEDGSNFDVLMQHADVAMYHVKENGRAGYHYFVEEMNARTHERLKMEHKLRLALERNEFELFYQPKVNIRTRGIVGAEALIRWRHPEDGMIPPGKFIPVAEESGLISQIGNWVAHETARQCKAWQDAGLPRIPVSFNVSARQFLHGNLLSVLDDVLAATGADPQYLELELTKSLLMQPQNVQSVLQQLKERGFSVALDDFGTGYSSLSYLSRMAIDTLKIDRSFVDDLGKKADDEAIAHTIIAMAHNLRMEVVAEGVETAEQADILLRGGCEVAQGYFFGKPQPVPEFAELLRKGL
ncbi:MAG: EAL domain-containing protein [Pseudomonadota bacterium]